MRRSSTSSSDARAALRFLARLGAFVAPLAGIALFLEAVLWRSGEGLPIGRVLAIQDAQPRAVFLRRYFSQDFTGYKARMIARRTPRTLVVGSSRVMQFRDLHFDARDGEFVNGGGLLRAGGDVVALAERLRDGALPRPRTLIVGIDPWWLKDDGRLNAGTLTADALRDDVTRPAAHALALRGLAKARPFPWDAIRAGNVRDGEPRIGLGARATGDGFRRDGSYRLATWVAEYAANPGYRDRETPPIIDRVRRGEMQFAPCAGLDADAAGRLIAALRAVAAAGVEVIAVLPPVVTEVDAAIRGTPALARWWADYWGPFADRLRAAGVPVVDVRTPARYGLDDRYMFDGIHPSEVLLTHVVEELADASRGSLRTIDRGRLRALRDRPGGTPLAFGALP